MTRFISLLTFFIFSSLQTSYAATQNIPSMENMLQRTTTYILRWKALPRELQDHFRGATPPEEMLKHVQNFSKYVEDMEKDKKSNPFVLAQTLQALIPGCPAVKLPPARKYKSLDIAVKTLWQEIENTIYGTAVSTAYRDSLEKEEAEDIFQIPSFFRSLLKVSYEKLAATSGITGFHILLEPFIFTSSLQVKSDYTTEASEKMHNSSDRSSARSGCTSTTWRSFDATTPPEEEEKRGDDRYDPNATNRVFSKEATPDARRSASLSSVEDAASAVSAEKRPLPAGTSHTTKGKDKEGYVLLHDGEPAGQAPAKSGCCSIQ
jgi:hypothetical protein